MSSKPVRNSYCLFNCDPLVQFTRCMHRFPHPTRNPVFYDAWVYAVGDILKEKNCLKVYNSKRICDKHFIYSHKISKNRLLPWAIPVYLNRVRQSLITFVECDHNYTFVPREYPEPPPQDEAGKTSTEFQQREGRLQGEVHKDHTYDVTDRNLDTLVVGTDRFLEKRIDLSADTKNTQKLEAAPEIEPVPVVEETFDPDYELQVSPASLPEVEDSGGEAVFSWQREEELIEADDPEEPPAPPADPTLALFCESDPDPNDPKANADPGPDFDPDPDIVFDPQPDQAVPSVPAPVDNRCKDCEEVNAGFEFWCVQCAGGALCGACAGRAPHHAHYVLRAPMGCSRARTQAVLTMIRQQAVLISISQQLENQNLLQHGTVDDDLKLEVKEEPAEVPSASSSGAEADPLACEPREPREPREPVSLDDHEPEFPHDLIEQLEPVSLRSPISLFSPRSFSRSPRSPPHSPTSLPSRPASPRSPPHSPTSLPSQPASPRSPPHSPTSLPSRPASPCSPPHSPTCLPSRPASPRSPPHSPSCLPSRPASPLSPRAPASPPEPAVTPEPATQKTVKIAGKIVEHREPLQRLRKPTDAREEILIPTQRKLVKVSPAEVKRAFLSHIERVVTTQNKQLKVYQPHVKLTPQVRENVVTTLDKRPTYEANSRTTRLQVRGSQAPMKVTSEPKSSETVTIDLDVEDETVEYLEEGLESDIETIDNVDNLEDDVLDEDDLDDDVLDEDYLLDEDDLEEAELEEDDLSDEERIVRNVPGRGVKRKKDAQETSPLKGPSESMVRALPSKAVIQVRPLSSLEIRNWTADRKRLRKD